MSVTLGNLQNENETTIEMVLYFLNREKIDVLCQIMFMTPYPPTPTPTPTDSK